MSVIIILAISALLNFWALLIMLRKDALLRKKDETIRAQLAPQFRWTELENPERANQLAKWILGALAALDGNVAIAPDSPAHMQLRKIIEPKPEN